MKKLLQFAGVISAALAVISFILMMATPGVVLVSGNRQYNYPGTSIIFGSDEPFDLVNAILGSGNTKPSPLALIGWILLLVGLIIVLVGVILPLLKINALEKFAGILDICSLICLVVAGIFMFIVVPSFYGANGVENIPDSAGIGAGWVIAGILAILAGAFAILPAAAAFLAKKK